MNEKREHQIAMETQAGREGLRVWRETVARMSGADKILKSFELTELTRQIMRSGIRSQYPDANEDEVQRMYVDRLLSYHGTTLEEIRRKQQQEPPSVSFP